MLPLVHKFRVVSKVALIQRYHLYSHPLHRARPIENDVQRNFHTTPSTQMAQLTDEPVVDVMQKLQNNPRAMGAATKFMSTAEKEGFHDTLNSGRMPSRMELLRVFSNPTMRKAAEDMVEAFSEAGIEFDQQTALKIVKSLREVPKDDPEKQ